MPKRVPPCSVAHLHLVGELSRSQDARFTERSAKPRCRERRTTALFACPTAACPGHPGVKFRPARTRRRSIHPRPHPAFCRAAAPGRCHRPLRGRGPFDWPGVQGMRIHRLDSASHDGRGDAGALEAINPLRRLTKGVLVRQSRVVTSSSALLTSRRSFQTGQRAAVEMVGSHRRTASIKVGVGANKGALTPRWFYITPDLSPRTTRGR